MTCGPVARGLSRLTWWLLRFSYSYRSIVAGATLALLLAAAGVLYAGSPGKGEPSPAGRGRWQGEPRQSLTIYNDGTALVHEARRAVLPEGVSELVLGGLPRQLEPGSVRFRSSTDPEGTRVLEQVYQDRRVDRKTLLQEYVGRQVVLAYADQPAVRGTLLAFEPSLIVETENGIVVDPRGELQLPGRASGRLLGPALRWRVEARRPGEQEVEITYLTGGLQWEAEYTGVLHGGRQPALELEGWISVQNHSGATFPAAHLRLVAGMVQRAQRDGGGPVPLRAMEAPGSEAVEGQPFFEYQLYTLDRPVTLRDGETTQVNFLARRRVPVVQEYWFHPDRWKEGRQPVHVHLRLPGDRAAGLGVPFPAGRILLYQAGAGEAEALIGEDRIAHTPVGEELLLHVGQAFDLRGEYAILERHRRGDKVEERRQITLRNYKEEDVIVFVEEPVPELATIVASSHPYQRVRAGALRFTVRVPAKGSVTIEERLLVPEGV